MSDEYARGLLKLAIAVEMKREGFSSSSLSSLSSLSPSLPSSPSLPPSLSPTQYDPPNEDHWSSPAQLRQHSV